MHGKSPGIRLRDVLPEAEYFGAEHLRFSSCCADSRQIRPGDLFVALKGLAHNGHDFIRDAIRRGAVGVISQERLLDGSLPVCVVGDSSEAFGRICQALENHPSRRIKVVGVTGTNGKTTTTHLIASILQAAGAQAGTLGTLGYNDGTVCEPAPLTTPTAPVLARWLSRMEAAGCSHVAMEVSSHALSQSRVAGIEFDAVCVTNVRHDHLDYHGTRARYHSAKARIFSHLRPEGVAIVNADDPGAASFLNGLSSPALSVGIRCAAEISATVVEQLPSEQTFLLHAGSETMPVRTPLIGTHNIYNCLVAAAVGLTYGIELATVVRGLEALRAVPGRLERIECGQPFSVFVDYAHTADALAGVLETLRALSSGKLICLFGAGGERDRFKRPVMGQVASEIADRLVITNDNPRNEDPRDIIEGILAGIPDRSQTSVIPDRAAAIGHALSLARSGDIVLIAGKGHEDYQHIGDVRRPFDDRQHARDWLYAHAERGELSWAGN